jgi:Xaa-Pro aminopeptidase
MRLDPMPKAEYESRIKRLQNELALNDIDVFIGYSSESESGTSRYLSGFWPFFDFVSIIVPVNGLPALVTGGPESYDFAKEFSAIENIYIDPLYVESSAPEWVLKKPQQNLAKILAQVCNSKPKKIGIANGNIFPYLIFSELKEFAPDAEFVSADNLLLNVQSIKSDIEIPYIEKAYKITEEVMKYSINNVSAGKSEWEISNAAFSKMLELGAEGTPYPAWVCSGENTRLSLCRSTNKAVKENELIQFTFGAKYMGVCGNMCRPLAIGKMPPQAKELAAVALEATSNTIKALKPGVKASDIFKIYYKLLSDCDLKENTLYGPAHGIGSSEVEGLWLSENADFIIQPNMCLSIDIWLTKGPYGLRYEDGFLITKSGLKELSNYKREIIEL